MKRITNDLEAYYIRRTPLMHLRDAIARGHLTIGFLGGSITEPAQGKRWGDKVVEWFTAAYPGVIVNMENAAKGATGSLDALFRVGNDIMNRGCDIVFVEYAVNDDPNSPYCSLHREGLLRKLVSNNGFDVVLTYAYGWGMYDSLSNHEMPFSVSEFEKLAQYYALSSVFMAAYAFNEVEKGRLRWEEWLPDTLHPEHCGSRIYATPVIDLLMKELASDQKAAYCVPEPLYIGNWEYAHPYPLEKIERFGAWILMRERTISCVDQVLHTASVASSLRFAFTGIGFTVRQVFNAYACDLGYRIDGGQWMELRRERQYWIVDATNYTAHDVIAANLDRGLHTVELRPLFGIKGDVRGANFDLCGVGVIP